MTPARVLAAAALFALATWFIGWWAVLIVAFVSGMLWRDVRAARYCALAAALGWAALLVNDARAGRLATVGGALGGVMRVPSMVLMIATLLFVAMAAWSAAAIGSELAVLTRSRARAQEDDVRTAA